MRRDQAHHFKRDQGCSTLINLPGMLPGSVERKAPFPPFRVSPFRVREGLRRLVEIQRFQKDGTNKARQL